MKKNQVDPFILTKKTVYMQRIADLVRLNHSRYVLGQIPVDKAQFFAAKMDLFYECNLDKVAAHRQRARGFCSTRLLFLHTENRSHLDWIMLVTPGEWPTSGGGNEKWLDPTSADSRVTVSGYELVRHIRPGNANPSWTWRYNAARYDELRNAIVMSIRRHNTQELRRLIDTTWRSPGFAGIRDQVKKIKALIEAEWTRSGVGDMPELPRDLGYVRRIPDKGKYVSKLLKELENGVG